MVVTMHSKIARVSYPQIKHLEINHKFRFLITPPEQVQQNKEVDDAIK